MLLIDQPWLQAHLAQYRADPVAAHDWDSAPVGGSGIRPTLLLTTLGARSGEPRAVPLLYQPCGEGYVVVGSRGGSNRHPAWYLNLLTHPDCSAQVGRLHCPLRARVLTGAERERYWSLMTHCWPAYLDYQKRTTRQIPVVILALTGAPTLTG
jgi:deazaflavin-dependent oxidoreductase (nitroreductase family)